MIRSCLDNLGSFLIGGVFLLAGIWVTLTVRRAESPLIAALLGLLLLHTAAMSIVGFGLEKATRTLAISWVVFVVVFLILAAVLHG